MDESHLCVLQVSVMFSVLQLANQIACAIICVEISYVLIKCVYKE